jgi:hypothetical protein
MRTKTITLGTGETLLIGSLTLEQTNALTLPTTEAEQKAASYQACIDSLNNAAGSAVWTLTSFTQHFDLFDFKEISKGVEEVSGYAPVGETQASV